MAFLVLAFLAPACSARRGLTPGDGFLEVPGGKVWYRIAGSGTATPLLLLHGGPGYPSHYLASLEALADERPVIFYDQLGGGRSERPADTSLWRIERFVEELARVRARLGLREVHLLGHSWGTMLAVDYMLTRPDGVRSVILASPCISVSRWIRDADRLRKTLPAEVQAVLARHEAAGTTSGGEYQEAVMQYYRRFVCRLDPWPREVLEAEAGFGQEVYETMWGPSEMLLTGNLRDYERGDRLREIAAPVLYTAGRHDEATPDTTAWYQSRTPGSRLVIFENSAHLTMVEEPGPYVEAIRGFLREVEESSQRGTMRPE